MAEQVANPVPAVPQSSAADTRMAKAMATLDVPALASQAAPGGAQAAPPSTPALPPPGDVALAAERAKHAIRQERQKLSTERAQWDTERKAEADRRAAYQRDPAMFLREFFPGHDPAQVVAALQQALQTGAPPPEFQVSSVKQEVDGLKEELKDRDRRAAEAMKKQQEREFQQATADVKSEISDFIGSNKEAYPVFLAAMEGEADATGGKVDPRDYLFAIIEAEYKRDLQHPDVVAGNREPKVTSYKEAAERAETFFVGKAGKLLGLAKLRGQHVPSLTPSLSAAAAPPPPPKAGRLTEKERLQRAIAAIPE